MLVSFSALMVAGSAVHTLWTAKGLALNTDKDRLTVTVDRQGRVFIGASEEQITVDQLVAKLKANAKNGIEDQVLFRGDRKVDYGKVSEVLGAVRDGGFKKFTFVSGPEDIESGPGKKR